MPTCAVVANALLLIGFLIDLEFNKSSNPQLTPTITEEFLTQLFVELRHQIQHTYNIPIERSCMVDLDASTPTKFSRHWILHLPNGDLFSDAREVGIFVNAFVSRLEAEKASGVLQSRGHELLADHLMVITEPCLNDDNPTKRLTRIIDLGVYTRNRIFRLMGSTKFGKPTTSALRIAEANEFPFANGFNNAKFYQPEMGKAPSDCDGNDAVDVSCIALDSVHVLFDHETNRSCQLPHAYRTMTLRNSAIHCAGKIMPMHWLQLWWFLPTQAKYIFQY